MTDAEPRFESPWFWRPQYGRILPVRDRVPVPVREAGNAVISNDGPWPFVMLGEAGAGKTCAALLMAAHVKTFVYFIRFRDWCDRLRWAKRGELQTSTGFKMTEPETWDEWRRAKLGVLDDIGAREVTDHALEAMLGVLDRREGLPLVCTSNLTLEELGNLFDDRVASRLSAGTIVYLEGDQRQRTGETKCQSSPQRQP